MTSVALVYPPSPDGVPADLTAPTRAYRWKVFAVLIGLCLFLVLYLAMIAGAPSVQFSGGAGRPVPSAPHGLWDGHTCTSIFRYVFDFACVASRRISHSSTTKCESINICRIGLPIDGLSVSLSVGANG